MQNYSTYNTNNIINLVREFIALTKPRVNLLIMFTAIVGMLLAHQSTLNYELIFFNAAFVSSKSLLKRLSSFDLSTEVVIIFFAESMATNKKYKKRRQGWL